MTVPLRTFALFGLALGMLATGYLFAPAPGASKSLPVPAPAPIQAKVVPPAPSRPDTTLVANRPPVPLVTAPRPTITVDRTIGSSPSDKPTVDMGTFSSNPPGPNDTKPAADITQALATPGGADDSPAKKAIEFDGYRNVRDLTKGPDGVWRGRAMRGRTEIAIQVDATGNVSAQ
jgi:hypothetical protein